jgi:squalene cyclase
VDLPGWWVDNVKIGRRSISRGRSVAEWSSVTQIRQKPVSGFTVQLVAYDDAGNNAWLGEIPLDANFDGTLSGPEVADAIGNSAETVAAIVTYDEPTELVTPPQYARYELTVNGVTQPGG